MQLRGYLVGQFPRTQSLIKCFRDYSKGKIAYSQLVKEIEEAATSIVSLQVENGLHYVIDGMLTWNDLFRPVTLSLEGVEINGLSRWYDNNVFFKKPIVKNIITVKKQLETIFFNSKTLSGHRWKAILPEPFTMAKLSENNHYQRFEELVYDLANAIATLASSLNDVSQIQLTAPSLVFGKPSKDELEMVCECLKIVKKKIGCELLIHMPFGSASHVLPHLLDSAADVLGIDLYKTSINLLYEYSFNKKLYLGVLDGRNTLMEDEETLLSVLHDIVGKTGLEELDVGPTCELEFLPYDIAVKKVGLLGKIIRERSWRSD